MNIKEGLKDSKNELIRNAAMVEFLELNGRCSEETAALVLIATEIRNLSRDNNMVISKQTVAINKLSAEIKSIRGTILALEEYAKEDLDCRLGAIATRISELEQTLFDTLASSKTGAALDALAGLPGAIREAGDEVPDWMKEEPDWLKEGRYVILD